LPCFVKSNKVDVMKGPLDSDRHLHNRQQGQKVNFVLFIISCNYPTPSSRSLFTKPSLWGTSNK